MAIQRAEAQTSTLAKLASVQFQPYGVASLSRGSFVISLRKTDPVAGGNRAGVGLGDVSVQTIWGLASQYHCKKRRL